MKLVNFKLLALFISSFLITLLITAPLHWWLPLMESSLRDKGIQLSDSRGNLWSGETEATMKGLGQFHVEWDVQVVKLALLQFAVDFHSFNADMDLNGEIALSATGISVKSLEGYADDSAFASIARTYKADINGRLTIQSLSAKMGWNKSLGAIEGQATWSGGAATVPVGRKKQTFEVPTMIANISGDSSLWQADIVSSLNQTYMKAGLSEDGTASLSVLKQLAEDMSIPVPSAGSSLLDITQKVF